MNKLFMCCPSLEISGSSRDDKRLQVADFVIDFGFMVAEIFGNGHSVIAGDGGVRGC